MSGSATPTASTRSRIRSSAFCMTALSVFAGAARTTDTPPVRSSPSSGRVPVTNPTSAASTSVDTTRMETIRGRLLFISVRHLQELRAVDVQLELAIEPFRSAPAHDHAIQEDLEVLHDVADLSVDGEFEGDGSGSRVYPEERLLGRVVHAVVDVEVDLGGLAHPGPVHVGLVGQDHGRRHRADRLPALLLV